MAPFVVRLCFGSQGHIECEAGVLRGASSILKDILSAEDMQLKRSSIHGPLLLSVADDKRHDWETVLSCMSGTSPTLETAAALLKLGDKYHMPQLLESVVDFLSSPDLIYNASASASGDPLSIWKWMATASACNQPKLVQHLQQLVIRSKMVPQDPADLQLLHPRDSQELLLQLMKAHAQVKFHCLSCAARRRTEIRLCSTCEFSQHFRV